MDQQVFQFKLSHLYAILVLQYLNLQRRNEDFLQIHTIILELIGRRLFSCHLIKLIRERRCLRNRTQNGLQLSNVLNRQTEVVLQLSPIHQFYCPLILRLELQLSYNVILVVVLNGDALGAHIANELNLFLLVHIQGFPPEVHTVGHSYRDFEWLKQRAQGVIVWTCVGVAIVVRRRSAFLLLLLSLYNCARLKHVQLLQDRVDVLNADPRPNPAVPLPLLGVESVKQDGYGGFGNFGQIPKHNRPHVAGLYFYHHRRVVVEHRLSLIGLHVAAIVRRPEELYDIHQKIDQQNDILILHFYFDDFLSIRASSHQKKDIK